LVVDAPEPRLVATQKAETEPQDERMAQGHDDLLAWNVGPSKRHTRRFRERSGAPRPGRLPRRVPPAHEARHPRPFATVLEELEQQTLPLALESFGYPARSHCDGARGRESFQRICWDGDDAVVIVGTTPSSGRARITMWYVDG
jgi:hypothetical protein